MTAPEVEEPDFDSGEGLYVDFSNTEPRQKFHLLPAGLEVILVIDDFEEKRSTSKKNPNAKMVNWTFRVESTLDGEDFVYNVRARAPEDNKVEMVEELKVSDRNIYDMMVFIESMYTRVQEFMEACGYEAEGNIRLVPSELVGERLIGKIGVQPRKKDKDTGEWYRARNKITGFRALPDDEEPAPVAAEAPVAEDKPKSKAKKEEAPETVTV